MSRTRGRSLLAATLLFFIGAPISDARADFDSQSCWSYEFDDQDGFNCNTGNIESSAGLTLTLQTGSLSMGTVGIGSLAAGTNPHIVAIDLQSVGGSFTTTLEQRTRPATLRDSTWAAFFLGHPMAAGDADSGFTGHTTRAFVQGVNADDVLDSGTANLRFRSPVTLTLAISNFAQSGPLVRAIASQQVVVPAHPDPVAVNGVSLDHIGNVQTFDQDFLPVADFEIEKTEIDADTFYVTATGNLTFEYPAMVYGGVGSTSPFNWSQFSQGVINADFLSQATTLTGTLQAAAVGGPYELVVENPDAASKVEWTLVPFPEPGTCDRTLYNDETNPLNQSVCVDITADGGGEVGAGHTESLTETNIVMPQVFLPFQTPTTHRGNSNVSLINSVAPDGSAVSHDYSIKLPQQSGVGAGPSDSASYGGGGLAQTKLVVDTGPLTATVRADFDVRFTTSNASETGGGFVENAFNAFVFVDELLDGGGTAPIVDAFGFHVRDISGGSPGHFESGIFVDECTCDATGCTCNAQGGVDFVVADGTKLWFNSGAGGSGFLQGAGITSDFLGLDGIKFELSSPDNNAFFSLISACPPSTLDPTDGDLDDDGVCDDGDSSGVAGDNPCIAGATQNCDDNCVDMPNPGQGDPDADGVGQVCDNCLQSANPRFGSLNVPARASFQTATGGQHDDDADGFGNGCDGKFGTSGQVVGGVDLSELFASFNKDRTQSNCGTGGQSPCSLFDLDSNGQFISGGDVSRLFQLFNQPPGPKCPACPKSCEGPGC